jgi:hypothetical protein
MTKRKITRLSRGEVRLIALPFVVIGALIVLTPLTVSRLATADTTSSTNISSIINPVISLITSGPSVNLVVTPSQNGSQTTASDVVRVSTNDSSGYNLSLQTTTAQNALASGANLISAPASGTLAPLAVNTWGYRIDGYDSFGAGPTTDLGSSLTLSSLAYRPVPPLNSADIIAYTSGTASQRPTTVWYGVVVDYNKPSGNYINSVLYTAAPN